MMGDECAPGARSPVLHAPAPILPPACSALSVHRGLSGNVVSSAMPVAVWCRVSAFVEHNRITDMDDDSTGRHSRILACIELPHFRVAREA